MLDCLRVADQICRGSLDPQSRTARWANQAPVALRFGDQLPSVVAGLGDFDSIVAEAVLFVQVDSGE
jgi:hypothetical protein